MKFITLPTITPIFVLPTTPEPIQAFESRHTQESLLRPPKTGHQLSQSNTVNPREILSSRSPLRARQFSRPSSFIPPHKRSVSNSEVGVRVGAGLEGVLPVKKQKPEMQAAGTDESYRASVEKIFSMEKGLLINEFFGTANHHDAKVFLGPNGEVVFEAGGKRTPDVNVTGYAEIQRNRDANYQYVLTIPTSMTGSTPVCVRRTTGAEHLDPVLVKSYDSLQRPHSFLLLKKHIFTFRGLLFELPRPNEYLTTLCARTDKRSNPFFELDVSIAAHILNTRNSNVVASIYFDGEVRVRGASQKEYKVDTAKDARNRKKIEIRKKGHKFIAVFYASITSALFQRFDPIKRKWVRELPRFSLGREIELSPDVYYQIHGKIIRIPKIEEIKIATAAKPTPVPEIEPERTLGVNERSSLGDGKDNHITVYFREARKRKVSVWIGTDGLVKYSGFGQIQEGDSKKSFQIRKEDYFYEITWPENFASEPIYVFDKDTDEWKIYQEQRWQNIQRCFVTRVEAGKYKIRDVEFELPAFVVPEQTQDVDEEVHPNEPKGTETRDASHGRDGDRYIEELKDFFSQSSLGRYSAFINARGKASLQSPGQSLFVNRDDSFEIVRDARSTIYECYWPKRYSVTKIEKFNEGLGAWVKVDPADRTMVEGRLMALLTPGKYRVRGVSFELPLIQEESSEPEDFYGSRDSDSSGPRQSETSDSRPGDGWWQRHAGGARPAGWARVVSRPAPKNETPLEKKKRVILELRADFRLCGFTKTGLFNLDEPAIEIMDLTPKALWRHIHKKFSDDILPAGVSDEVRQVVRERLENARKAHDRICARMKTEGIDGWV